MYYVRKRWLNYIGSNTQLQQFPFGYIHRTAHTQFRIYDPNVIFCQFFHYLTHCSIPSIFFGRKLNLAARLLFSIFRFMLCWQMAWLAKWLQSAPFKNIHFCRTKKKHTRHDVWVCLRLIYHVWFNQFFGIFFSSTLCMWVGGLGIRWIYNRFLPLNGMNFTDV